MQSLGTEQNTNKNKTKQKGKMKVEIIQDHRISEVEAALGNQKRAPGPAPGQTIGSKERSRRG